MIAYFTTNQYNVMRRWNLSTAGQNFDSRCHSSLPLNYFFRLLQWTHEQQIHGSLEVINVMCNDWCLFIAVPFDVIINGHLLHNNFKSPSTSDSMYNVNSKIIRLAQIEKERETTAARNKIDTRSESFLNNFHNRFAPFRWGRCLEKINQYFMPSIHG
jgi:hypothetical protein